MHDKPLVAVGNKFVNLAMCHHVEVVSDGTDVAVPASVKIHFGQTCLVVEGDEAEVLLEHMGGCCHDLKPAVEKKQKAAAAEKDKVEKAAAKEAAKVEAAEAKAAELLAEPLPEPVVDEPEGEPLKAVHKRKH
jgi:hypothetical protein